jgi:hypothetical protein
VTEIMQRTLMLLNNSLSIKSYHSEFHLGNLQISVKTMRNYEIVDFLRVTA